MKRFTSALLTVFLLAVLCAPVRAAAPKVVDYALYTDIVAKIDGHALRSYNIRGYIAVVAEDLRDYGFRVVWDASARTLRITRAQTPVKWPGYTPPVNTHRVGERALPVYSTDIKTYADDVLIDSFNINGETLVWLRSLSGFGRVVWDMDSRVSSLTLGEGATPPPAPTQTAPANPTSSSNRKLHILMYHQIVAEMPDEIGDWTTTAALLRKDLQWLKDNGYTTYLPSELAAGVPLAERSVLITFDDGYDDNCSLALPLLQEYGMKAVVSVVCNYVEQGDPGFLTWDMCRKMADSGLIEFGSHTYDLHDGIRRRSGESKDAYLARVSADLQKSVDKIKAETGQDAIFFAYPHGERESWAEDYLKQTFAMTVTTQHGAANIGRGFYNLPRYNINSKQPVSMFLPAAK